MSDNQPNPDVVCIEWPAVATNEVSINLSISRVKKVLKRLRESGIQVSHKAVRQEIYDHEGTPVTASIHDLWTLPASQKEQAMDLFQTIANEWGMNR